MKPNPAFIAGLLCGLALATIFFVSMRVAQPSISFVPTLNILRPGQCLAPVIVHKRDRTIPHCMRV